MTNSQTRRIVEQACQEEGRYVANRCRADGLNDEVVMGTFNALIAGKLYKRVPIPGGKISQPETP